MILSIIRWAALIIVPLVLLFLLWRLLVGSQQATDEEDVYDFPDDAGLTPALDTMPTMQMQSGPQVALRESLADLAREKPEVVAGVIGRWMEEDHA